MDVWCVVCGVLAPNCSLAARRAMASIRCCIGQTDEQKDIEAQAYDIALTKTLKLKKSSASSEMH